MPAKVPRLLRILGMFIALSSLLAASELWQNSFVEDQQSGSTLHLLQAGAEHKDTVILIHGMGENGLKDWYSVIPELQKRFHVLALDLPGFGASSEPQKGYSLHQYAEVIHRVRENYAKGKVSVVGHSMGGAIALRYAADFPDDFRTLVLVDAAAILHRTAFVKYMAELDIDTREGAQFWIRFKARFKDFFGSMVEVANGWSLPVNLEAKSDTLADSPEKIFYSSAAMAMVKEDFSHLVDRVKQRTYLIWGDRDATAPLRTGKVLAKRLSNASLHVIKGAEHVPMASHTQEFNALLGQILSEGMARAASEESMLLSNRKLHCDREAGKTYSGAFDEIIIDHAQAIRLENVTARKITVIQSLVSFENVRVISDEVALDTHESVIEMSNAALSGKVAIHSEGSRLDMAGVMLSGDERALTVGTMSRIVASLCQSSSRRYTGAVHGDFKLKKTSLDAQLK